VKFSCDPSYPTPYQAQSASWRDKTYLLASIPLRKPRTALDNAADFLSSAVSSPLSFFSASSPTKSTPDEIFNGDIDLREDEVLDQDRGEEGETDDSPKQDRQIRMLTLDSPTAQDQHISEKARKRRRWEVAPLRLSDARTGI
jgi:hypothetical protein